LPKAQELDRAGWIEQHSQLTLQSDDLIADAPTSELLGISINFVIMDKVSAGGGWSIMARWRWQDKTLCIALCRPAAKVSALAGGWFTFFFLFFFDNLHLLARWRSFDMFGFDIFLYLLPAHTHFGKD